MVAQVAQIVLLGVLDALAVVAAVEDGIAVIHELAAAFRAAERTVHRTAVFIRVHTGDVAAGAGNVAGKGETFKRYNGFSVGLLQVFRSFP